MSAPTSILNHPAAVSISLARAGAATHLVLGADLSLLEPVAEAARSHSVTLDMGTVKRIDAAGVAALLAIYESARGAGNFFLVANASPRVARILAVLGLDRILLSGDQEAPSRLLGSHRHWAA